MLVVLKGPVHQVKCCNCRNAYAEHKKLIYCPNPCHICLKPAVTPSNPKRIHMLQILYWAV